MIEQKGLAVFNKAVAETITRAVCTISGKDYTLPIKSVTVEGATFKVNIYLDDTLSGTVTNTKLYDKDGNLLIQRQDVARRCKCFDQRLRQSPGAAAVLAILVVGLVLDEVPAQEGPARPLDSLYPPAMGSNVTQHRPQGFLCCERLVVLALQLLPGTIASKLHQRPGHFIDHQRPASNSRAANGVVIL